MAFDDLPAPHAASHRTTGTDPLSGFLADLLAAANTWSGQQTFSAKLTATAGSQLGGYIQYSAAFTVNALKKYYEMTASAAVPTLAGATLLAGFDFYLINTYTAAITVTANGTDKIGNTASATTTYSIPAGATLHIVSNGNNWRIL